MASSKSFFGKRRGSTKNFTFTVFNGKQITKEKAEQVKNPRTLAQMRNRMVLTTSSAAYAAMKEIVDHSFQGYTYGLQNMSRFQSINNKLLRENIAAENPQFAYCEYGKAKLLPGAYIVADGSLTSFTNQVAKAEVTSGGLLNISFGAVGASGGVTANDILSAAGMQVGELATILAIVPVDSENDYKFFFVRIASKQAGDVVLTADNFGDYFTVETNVPFDNKSFSNGRFAVSFAVYYNAANLAWSWGSIHSALVNGTWQRSASVMAVSNASALAPTADSAIATYPIGGSYILNDGDIRGGYPVVEPSGDDDPEPGPEP